jgi:hypothetical protein
MVADRSGRRVWIIFLVVRPVRAWGSRETARAVKHDGHVGFDAVADAMEDRPCCEVGFGHPERSFDLVEVSVGGDHAWVVHRVGADVGDVAFQPGQVAG